MVIITELSINEIDLDVVQDKEKHPKSNIDTTIS